MEDTNDKIYAESLIELPLDKRILSLRAEALSRHIPVTEDASLQYLIVLLTALQPKRILEVGPAVGLSAAAMLSVCPNARLTTIEIEEERYIEAKKNLHDLGYADRAVCHLGDAGEILSLMDATYDFVFLDGPKAQYPRYMTELKRMLPQGGVVFADDVLLFGWVSGQTPTPEKHKLFVKHMREYLKNLSEDKDFVTQILPIGNGVALSVKR